jgi:predicted nuclease of predicted toxin-antitoxin system
LKQPDQLTFFLDRSLGKELIATALREAKVLVEVHDDQFAPNAKDEEWLAEVGRRGWIVLTKDRRFHTRVLEIDAIARTKAKVFKLTAANIQGADMAAIFLKAIRKISRVAVGNPGPFIATVSKSGKVIVVLSSSKLRKYLS